MLRLVLAAILGLSGSAAASEWVPCSIVERVNIPEALRDISVQRAPNGTIEAMTMRGAAGVAVANFDEIDPGTSVEMFVQRSGQGRAVASFQRVTTHGEALVRIEGYRAVEDSERVRRMVMVLRCPD